MDIFEEIRDTEVYKCKVCPKNPTIEYKNIKRHLEDNDTHERCIKPKDKDKHEDLLRILKETKRPKKKNETIEEEIESSKQKKVYLKFTAACFHAKLSFQQIRKIGLALREIYLDNEASFVAKYHFSLDEIGNLANCWGDYLKDNLIEDNSTISGTNISCLQLRYLKEKKSVENDVEIGSLEIQIG